MKEFEYFFFGQAFPTWGFSGGSVVPGDKRKRFWNYELDYNYACRASELGLPRI